MIKMRSKKLKATGKVIGIKTEEQHILEIELDKKDATVGLWLNKKVEIREI